MSLSRDTGRTIRPTPGENLQPASRTGLESKIARLVLELEALQACFESEPVYAVAFRVGIEWRQLLTLLSLDTNLNDVDRTVGKPEHLLLRVDGSDLLVLSVLSWDPQSPDKFPPDSSDLNSTSLELVLGQLGEYSSGLVTDEASGADTSEIASRRERALSSLFVWARLIPAEQRQLYLLTVHDVLAGASTIEELERLRSCMLASLLDDLARRFAAAPEGFSPTLLIAAATIAGSVLVLGVTASIVQIATAALPLWVVIAMWVMILCGGVVAGWWRWRQLSKHDGVIKA